MRKSKSRMYQAIAHLDKNTENVIMQLRISGKRRAYAE